MHHNHLLLAERNRTANYKLILSSSRTQRNSLKYRSYLLQTRRTTGAKVERQIKTMLLLSNQIDLV